MSAEDSEREHGIVVVMEAISALLSAVERVVPTEEKPQVASLAARLSGVPTIALAGRVSSGKSTLVNALVGAQIAPTDAGECTRVATLYECGAPERFELHPLGDGQPARIRGLAPDDLGMPPGQVDYAVAYTPQSRLRDQYRVIDTPGLSSHEVTSEKATRRALIDFGGLPQPEVLLFLVEGGHLRTDEVDFLRAMGATRLNTIVVISRADVAGDGVLGATDPFDTAAEHAERLAREHNDLARTAIPVAGLMAESAEIGISEAEAAALGRLADLDEFELAEAVERGDDPVMAALHDKVGLYGLVHGRRTACRGAIALSDWLIERSGLGNLHRAINDRIAHTGGVLKARTTLAVLRQLAWTSAARSEVLTLLERAELSAELHCLRELAAMDRLVLSASSSPLIQELEHVLRADNPRQLVGVPRYVGDAELRDAALGRISACRSRKLTVFSGAEREALTVLERSYQLAAGRALG